MVDVCESLKEVVSNREHFNWYFLICAFYKYVVNLLNLMIGDVNADSVLFYVF